MSQCSQLIRARRAKLDFTVEDRAQLSSVERSASETSNGAKRLAYTGVPSSNCKSFLNRPGVSGDFLV